MGGRIRDPRKGMRKKLSTHTKKNEKKDRHRSILFVKKKIKERPGIIQRTRDRHRHRFTSLWLRFASRREKRISILASRIKNEAFEMFHVLPRGISFRSIVRNPSVRTRLSEKKQANGTRVRCLFTGIVQGKGKVSKVETRGNSFRSLEVDLPKGTCLDIEIGASVAINGTCLTVVEAFEDRLRFDVIEETLRATNLGQLKVGDEINYERSARLGDEIGGHSVSGHVRCTARVERVLDTKENREVFLELPPGHAKYVLPKGFVALDGCSLTVGRVEGDRFNVYLIPETLRVTILERWSVGDLVNVEIDAQTQAIVDTVERLLEEKKSMNMG